MRSAGIIAVLALVAGAGSLGYLRGGADCRSEYQARELEQVRKSNELDEARREAERERDALSRQLEEEAHADPVAVPQCLGAGRVLRLNGLR
ncbi:hypothetical protein [Tritonibacter scottomollicae]|uniref:hypothetical protein n=1 Tax=Tritonibacter scottomollicae TaxID=483013 RepID=UPI003AA98DA1